MSLESLRALVSFLRVDLYIKQGSGRSLVLYRERNHPVKPSDLDRLAKRGIHTLYVSTKDREAYHAAVHEGLYGDGRISPARRYRIFQDFSKVGFQWLFCSGTYGDLVEMAGGIVESLIGLICCQELDVRDLFNLLDHDDGIYTHSLNVTAYSLLLAWAQGIRQRPELEAIALGALLHDLGKRKVLLETFHRTGPLNSRQRKELRNHPVSGFRELIRRGDLGWGQLMMVYQHHERVDGTGYPVELPCEEIHPWARLCSVANVFCTLTSYTSYRKRMSIDDALLALDKEAGTSLDGEMVQCWKTLLTAGTPSSGS